MTYIEVLLTRAQVEALLVGTDADMLEDARRQLRAARSYDTLRQHVEASRGPAPERRAGADRRGSVHVAQMLDE